MSSTKNLLTGAQCSPGPRWQGSVCMSLRWGNQKQEKTQVSVFRERFLSQNWNKMLSCCCGMTRCTHLGVKTKETALHFLSEAEMFPWHSCFPSPTTNASAFKSMEGCFHGAEGIKAYILLTCTELSLTALLQLLSYSHGHPSISPCSSYTPLLREKKKSPKKIP